MRLHTLMVWCKGWILTSLFHLWASCWITWKNCLVRICTIPTVHTLSSHFSMLTIVYPATSSCRYRQKKYCYLFLFQCWILPVRPTCVVQGRFSHHIVERRMGVCRYGVTEKSCCPWCQNVTEITPGIYNKLINRFSSLATPSFWPHSKLCIKYCQITTLTPLRTASPILDKMWTWDFGSFMTCTVDKVIYA